MFFRQLSGKANRELNADLLNSILNRSQYRPETLEGPSSYTYLGRKSSALFTCYLSISPAAFWEYCPGLLQCLSAKVPLGML